MNYWNMTCDICQLEQTSQIFPLCNFTNSCGSKPDIDLFCYRQKNVHGMPVRFSLALHRPPHQIQNSPLFRLLHSSVSAPVSSLLFPFSFPDFSIQHHAPCPESTVSLHTIQLTELPFFCKSLSCATHLTLSHQLYWAILIYHWENGRPYIWIHISSFSHCLISLLHCAESYNLDHCYPVSDPEDPQM